MGNPVTAAADTADNSSHIVTCSGHVPPVVHIHVNMLLVSIYYRKVIKYVWYIASWEATGLHANKQMRSYVVCFYYGYLQLWHMLLR